MADNLLIQDTTIRALARLAEIRDPETGNHLRRTQGYVRTLAMELCSHPRFADFLTRRRIEVLIKSAPLHDIGKVGIKDHILRKRGKLTPDEWAIMKTHSDIGSFAIEQVEADAERPVAFLQCAKLIIRHHHEKWDGSGYPDGLAGDAIPIAARLMALADVFDALISRRPYKEPFSGPSERPPSHRPLPQRRRRRPHRLHRHAAPEPGPLPGPAHRSPCLALSHPANLALPQPERRKPVIPTGRRIRPVPQRTAPPTRRGGPPAPLPEQPQPAGRPGHPWAGPDRTGSHRIRLPGHRSHRRRPRDSRQRLVSDRQGGPG
jgi:hypothetical protein